MTIILSLKYLNPTKWMQMNSATLEIAFVINIPQNLALSEWTKYEKTTSEIETENYYRLGAMLNGVCLMICLFKESHAISYNDHSLSFSSPITFYDSFNTGFSVLIRVFCFYCDETTYRTVFSNINVSFKRLFKLIMAHI